MTQNEIVTLVTLVWFLGVIFMHEAIDASRDRSSLVAKVGCIVLWPVALPIAITILAGRCFGRLMDRAS